MSFEQVAVWLMRALAVYALIGVLFAPAFVLRGIGKIDPAAKGASWGFRLVVLPGVVALWPLLWRRWLAGSPPPVERNAHRAAAGSRVP
jgi:hypothetical protein